LFLSEFLIITSTLQAQPWLTPLLLLGLGVAFAGIFPRLQSMVFGVHQEGVVRQSAVGIIPVFIQLALVAMLGVFIPLTLDQWMQHAAQLLHG
ncbi:hydrogenase 4 subunit F, partial [Acidithiobacillus ferridurans]|nr:hydrogenase 4 subunit F [Acidithiobacillus ferridurans]